MQLFIFPLCKIFESEVQVTDGFLTRPVRGYQSHDHTGHNEESNDYEGSFHMASVPCSLPNMRLMAIAVMNIPAMIQIRSTIRIFPSKWRLLSL